MKKFLITAALAAGGWAGAAQAAPTITYTPGGTGVPTNAGTAVIQSFDTLLPGTSIGTNAAVYAVTVPGIASKPLTSILNFGAVGAGGNYSVAFNPTSVFSFVVGSLDTYNRLVLSFVGGGTQTYTGGQIIGGLPFNSGSSTDTSGNGSVSFDANGGPLINGATFFSDGGNAFEIDTLTAAVPEPAAWGMMILGFGLVGGVLRRRSVKVRYA